MKKIHPSIKEATIFLLFAFGVLGNLFSQTATVSGPSAVSSGATEYYEASFDYGLNPYTNVYWSVSGGTITSQSINPTSTLWCTVQWDNNAGLGDVSIYEDMGGGYGSRTVDVGSPDLLPSGPITWYNQYETVQQDVIWTNTSATRYQWYKNGNPINGATSSQYTIQSFGSSTYTDYYYVATPSGTSNTLTFNYHGCVNASQYPVPIPVSPCESSFPVTATAPYLANGTYYIEPASQNSPFYTSSYSNPFHATISIGNCPNGCNDGYYAVSSIANQERIEMYFVLTAIPPGYFGCRTKSVAVPETTIQSKGKIFPTPAASHITIIHSKQIEKIEIYNMLGSLVKQIKTNGTSNVEINVSTLSPGIYSCRIITNTGVENQKFVIHR